MENKNALILGVIKRVLDYGNIAEDISLQSIETIFGDQNISKQPHVEVNSDFDELQFLRYQLDSQMMMTQMLSEQLIRLESQTKSVEEIPIYQHIYSKLCTEERVLKEMFTDISLVKLNGKNKYSKIVFSTRKMGMTLLCTAGYNGTTETGSPASNTPPSIVMSAFIRMSIDSVFDTENDKYKYKPDIFRQKMNELFGEANKANYSLAICAIEPFGAKMFFYTNEISLYYTFDGQVMVVSKSDKEQNKQPSSSTYAEFSVDYARNSLFYLPTFSIVEGGIVEDLEINLKQLLQDIHKQGINRQKQEIQSLFTNIQDTQAEALAGDSILIFKI